MSRKSLKRQWAFQIWDASSPKPKRDSAMMMALLVGHKSLVADEQPENKSWSF